MITFDEPYIRQIKSDLKNSTEKVQYKDVSKTILEIWEGEGNNPDDLFNTVRLDRNSRKYVHIQVKNMIKTYDKNQNYEQ